MSIDSSLETLFEEVSRRMATHSGDSLSLRRWTDLAESWRIQHALRETRGNRSAAARVLGIGRRTLYWKLERLGIDPDSTTPFPPNGTTHGTNGSHASVEVRE